MNDLTGPVQGSERIESLDVLRGLALLGILLMNIQSFAMPGAAYLNPMAYGSLEGLDGAVWVVTHLFADQKFMAIFSMLFGAGICLFADRAVASRGRAAGLHYRRTLWLLVFGLIHAHFIWYGDILYSYALCGLWVYLFRNRSPRTLIITGVVITAVHTLFYLFSGMSLQHFPPEALAEINRSWSPTAAQIAEEVAWHQAGYLEQLPHRSGTAAFMETQLFLMIFLWRAGGMMLIGMGLYKLGVLSAERDRSFYIKLLVAGAALGLALSGWGLYQNMSRGFPMEYSFFLGSQWNYWGSIGAALAWIAAVMLMVKAGAWPGLQSRLAAVGRTAFSNYILQSVIMTFIFYGHGLGLFGELSRTAQLGMVLAVWVLQLVISPLWLARYRFGPMEWAWRSLTYWQRQPMRRT